MLPVGLAAASLWLPSGATVTALRNAIYFPDNQYWRPVAVLAAWAVGLLAAMIAVCRQRRVSPGAP